MDGTLLDGRGAVPGTFWPLLERLHGRGITFVPASGRQHATLAQMFAPSPAVTSFIAENGTLVVHDGTAVAAAILAPATVRRIVGAVRAAAAHDLGLVVCGRRSAYVERRDAAFVREARRYYAELRIVDDLTAVEDEVLKLATYDFVDAEVSAREVIDPVSDGHQVVVSGRHWVDTMARGVDKGTALRALQRTLGVTPAQTAVFGDYLNDIEMLDAGALSFAVANAHPEVRARARYLAPSNDEHGAITALAHLVPEDRPPPPAIVGGSGR